MTTALLHDQKALVTGASSGIGAATARALAAEDVARTVVWLASDESDYITGASLAIDGGMLLYPAFRQGG